MAALGTGMMAGATGGFPWLSFTEIVCYAKSKQYVLKKILIILKSMV